MRDSDARLQQFAEFLSRAGLKTTRQRRHIVQAFFDAGRHLTAEQLYQQLQDQDPGIGLVTVYRTLKLLREAGMATGRKFADAYTRFDPTPVDRPHDHLICVRCGRIQEFEEPILYTLRARTARRHGFTVTEHRLDVYGLCRDCARLGKTANGRSHRSSRTGRA
jgi:Fur family transcriptional regulator, ferric uptake regulator